jgi:hypothetical protein
MTIAFRGALLKTVDREGFLSTATNTVEELTGQPPIPTTDVARGVLPR